MKEEQHNRINTSESQGPQDSTGVLEISGNLLIFWYDLSFAVCEDPGRFWRGSFRVPKQLSPPQQANARGRAFPGPEACGPKHGRVGWVIAMIATCGLLGIRGSDRSGRGAHPGTPCTISSKMHRGIPWTVRLRLLPVPHPARQTAQLLLTQPAHHQSRVCTA